MRRLLLAILVGSGLVLLAPSPALACSCVLATPSEYVERADTVFEGTLAWMSSDGRDASYGVEVDQVFKGRAATFEKLRSAADSAACGLGELVTERRYVFFVQGENPGQMRVGSCGGTSLATADLVAEVTQVAGESTEPIPARTPVAEAGREGLGLIGWTVVGGFVALLVLMGTTALKRP